MACNRSLPPYHHGKPTRRAGWIEALTGTGPPFDRDRGVGQVVTDGDHPSRPVLVGSKRVDDDPYGNWTQFDDTELPQHRVWLDTYEMDRDEVSLGEYLAFLQQRKLHPSDELQKLIWHVITIHSIADQTLSRWPALYITWAEAKDLCVAKSARLPTEAEWEKAARGSEGGLFPWGTTAPNPTVSMFGQHHVHEIPILAAVDSHEAGKSPYGLHHMAGNVAEWVQDWFGPDYYAYMPERHPRARPAGDTRVFAAARGKVTRLCSERRPVVAQRPINVRPQSVSAARPKSPVPDDRPFSAK